MNRFTWMIMSLLVVTAASAPLRFAFQGNVARGPLGEPRDPELEKEALHNLEVAQFYIKKKKWTAARSRLQEIVAKNPNFSAIPEVYFLLGEVYVKTNERDLAAELYARVVEEFPQSEFAEKARARMQKLGLQEQPSHKTDSQKQGGQAKDVYTRGGIGRV
jgi:TolA-binding protein